MAFSLPAVTTVKLKSVVLGLGEMLAFRIVDTACWLASTAPALAKFSGGQAGIFTVIVLVALLEQLLYAVAVTVPYTAVGG